MYYVYIYVCIYYIGISISGVHNICGTHRQKFLKWVSKHELPKSFMKV